MISTNKISLENLFVVLKVKNIQYKKLETKAYIRNPLFTNNDISLLSALRSHTVRDIKCNFPSGF